MGKMIALMTMHFATTTCPRARGSRPDLKALPHLLVPRSSGGSLSPSKTGPFLGRNEGVADVEPLRDIVGAVVRTTPLGASPNQARGVGGGSVRPYPKRHGRAPRDTARAAHPQCFHPALAVQWQTRHITREVFVWLSCQGGCHGRASRSSEPRRASGFIARLSRTHHHWATLLEAQPSRLPFGIRP